MHFDYAHLAALAAVIRTGSFEKAAHSLSVTPSAVSQRIKLLEERTGTVLVVRGQPCTATATGLRLCRHAEEVSALEASLAGDLGYLQAGDERTTLRIAVNADSLATWFIPALAATPGFLFDLVVDDEGHSADWLRRGEVSAAVTSTARPVQGCDARALGEMRYVATATPAFVAQHLTDGISAATLARAPALTFSVKDTYQQAWVRKVCGRNVTLPSHWLPSSHGFVDACLAGLGWCTHPLAMVKPHLDAGRLVELAPGSHMDIPLYWQWNRIVSGALKGLNKAVIEAAQAGMNP